MLVPLMLVVHNAQKLCGPALRSSVQYDIDARIQTDLYRLLSIITMIIGLQRLLIAVWGLGIVRFSLYAY